MKESLALLTHRGDAVFVPVHVVPPNPEYRWEQQNPERCQNPAIPNGGGRGNGDGALASGGGHTELSPLHGTCGGAQRVLSHPDQSTPEA